MGSVGTPYEQTISIATVWLAMARAEEMLIS